MSPMTELSNEQITDALVLPYLNHAVRMFETGYATRDDIDAAMRFGCGYPVGPLSALDARGLAAVAQALEARHAQTGDALHAPAALLADRVAAGAVTIADADGEAAAPAPQLRHDIQRVGVVGTGTMASGIAQVFAQAGFDVVYVGRGEEKVAGVRAFITKALDKSVARGKLDEAGKESVLARLTGATEREALADVDLVVEAIAEDLDIKSALFASASPGPSWPPPPPRCPSPSSARSLRAPSGSSGCTSSTPRR